MTASGVSMRRVRSFDGVGLHVQECGSGTPVLFVHELLGNGASFAPVIARLPQGLRCITYNARGYPPSQVPPFSTAIYSEAAARTDLLAVLDHLELERAHLVGVSMGAACCLNAALAAPGRIASMVLASIGSGSDNPPEAQAVQLETMATQFETRRLEELLQEHGSRPNRRSLAANEPESWRIFQDEFMNLSPAGLANTLRGVQKRRPPLYALEAQVRTLAVPALVVLGEQDAPCRKPCEFLADTLPQARLEVVAAAGHTPNLERPELFAGLVRDFIASHTGSTS
jgi:pimeloyl-ACP methyl ester carboxylesterase